MDYTQSATIAGFIACMMSSNAKTPTITEMYDWLFKDDNNVSKDNDKVIVDGKEYKKMSKADMDLEMQKERFKQFVKTHNEQFNNK